MKKVFNYLPLSLILILLISGCNSNTADKKVDTGKDSTKSEIVMAKPNDTLCFNCQSRDTNLVGNLTKGGESIYFVRFNDIKKIKLELLADNKESKAFFYFVNQTNECPFTPLHSYEGMVSENSTYTIKIQLDSLTKVDRTNFDLRISK